MADSEVLQPRSLSDYRGRNLSLARWPHARSKALWPITVRGAFSGGLGIVLIIVVVLVLAGRI